MTPPVLPDPDRQWLASLDRGASQDALHERVAAAWRLCRDVHPSLPRPRVWLDLRGKGAGQTHFGRGGLRFNPVLFDDNRHAFMVEVVPHEMAHWLVHHLSDGQGVAPHGHEWRTVMRELFGLTPQATHDFDTRRASPAPYQYRCQCREHGFTARRHGLARKGRQYVCRRCRQPLVYTGCRESC
ncbi:SprT family zinc-dependent metalloprotease [Halomonas halmophila]|uniref:SprT family zinc-dependent metalloprotease n=1 Tax=Halomonas halmophila TaxID=252 RepID=UPI001142B74F|nr:SprT-like domain-containing protein [Halomonas halmophila]